MDNFTLDPDPNWAKILDPDPNSMYQYLDPQHCIRLEPDQNGAATSIVPALLLLELEERVEDPVLELLHEGVHVQPHLNKVTSITPLASNKL